MKIYQVPFWFLLFLLSACRAQINYNEPLYNIVVEDKNENGGYGYKLEVTGKEAVEHKWKNNPKIPESQKSNFGSVGVNNPLNEFSGISLPMQSDQDLVKLFQSGNNIYNFPLSNSNTGPVQFPNMNLPVRPPKNNFLRKPSVQILNHQNYETFGPKVMPESNNGKIEPYNSKLTYTNFRPPVENSLNSFQPPTGNNFNLYKPPIIDSSSINNFKPSIEDNFNIYKPSIDTVNNFKPQIDNSFNNFRPIMVNPYNIKTPVENTFNNIKPIVEQPLNNVKPIIENPYNNKESMFWSSETTNTNIPNYLPPIPLNNNDNSYHTVNYQMSVVPHTFQSNRNNRIPIIQNIKYPKDNMILITQGYQHPRTVYHYSDPKFKRSL